MIGRGHRPNHAKRSISRRSAGPTPRRVILGTLPIALAVLLILEAGQVRLIEAGVQRCLLALFGVHARRVGSTVIFPLHDHLYGVALTAGCSVGPVLAIFLTAVGVVAWFRELGVSTVLLGSALIAALFVIVNEIRIAVIVGAIHRWGFRRGYEFSHVFIGSAISTTGFVLAVFVFVRVLLRRQSARGAA